MKAALVTRTLIAAGCWMALPVHAAPFTISPDGTEVTDHSTGLIWRRCMEGQSGSNCSDDTALNFTHEAALARAQSQHPWRLPSVKELATLLDRRYRDPVIDQTVFPLPYRDYWFWTSTPSLNYPGMAWTITFGEGLVLSAPRKEAFHIRLVR